MNAVDRRIAQVEAALDQIAPKPSEYDRFMAANPWMEWVSCLELEELEQIYRRAEEAGEMPKADEARGLAIMYASQARMLAGEPKDADRPQEPYDVKLAYERSKRALEGR